MAHIDGGSVLRGEWQPPEQSKIMFGGYATHWIAVTWRWIVLPPDGALVAQRSSASGSFGINRGDASTKPSSHRAIRRT